MDGEKCVKCGRQEVVRERSSESEESSTLSLHRIMKSGRRIVS